MLTFRRAQRTTPPTIIGQATTLPTADREAAEIMLVLDTGEVHLKAGDTVVQRGANHAWSNRSDRPCVVAISSHDAAA